MRKVVTTNRFEKRLVAFIKSHPELQKEIEKTIQILCVQDILPAAFKAHTLKGSLSGCVSVWISYSYRLIFLRTDSELSLIDIGNHDTVYR